MSLPYRYIIGLEVHVELQTQTKMFCRCLNDPFGVEPNTHVCPVCAGLPGTLPVPNREAVRKSILVGKALGSTIAKLSKWDRKHYFYPDLPKGYQISQFDMPLCIGGALELLAPDGTVESTVRFERAHLEEDAGKLMHGAGGYSLVDLNRAGVPLLEMVTLPDLTSPDQARRFMQEMRLLMRTIGVSDADMEKGQMRCDVNVNIAFTHEGVEVKTPITEVKNVNSTRAVERSIQVEAQRMYDEWMAGGPIRTRKNKLTAGWDEDTNSVTIQRAKEAANDYRYFPEPDLPPIAVYELPDLHPDNLTIPELPNVTRRAFLAEGVSMADADIFLNDHARRDQLRTLVRETGKTLKQVANWLINAPDSASFSTDQFAELLDLTDAGELSFSAVKPRLTELQNALQTHKTVREAATHLGLLQVHDAAVVQLAIEAVVAENPAVVAEYKAGNERVFGFLVGNAMKKCAGKAQPAKLQAALKDYLSAT